MQILQNRVPEKQQKQDLGNLRSGHAEISALEESFKIIGEKITAYVMGFSEDMEDIVPQVWITAYPVPFKKKELILYESI